MASLKFWKALCASSLGGSHTTLQDYSEGVTYPFPALIIADGAGSEVHSDIGAETAVKSSLDYIRWNTPELDDRESCLDLHASVLAALEKRAQQLEVKISTLATTLSLTYVLAGTVYWMQIGDGYILAQRNGLIGCVSVPTKGEFENQTVFVTCPDASDLIQHGSFPVSQCDGIIAFTDGLESALVNKRTLIPAPVCSSLIKQLNQKPLTFYDLRGLLNNRLFAY